MANKKEKNDKKTLTAAERNRLGIISVLVFFLILVVAALFITYTAFGPGESMSMDIPEINTHCMSSADGKSHSLKATFTVTGNKAMLTSVGKMTIFDDLKDTITKMDFSDIPVDDSDQYMKDYVQNYLNSKYKGINITEVRLTDFATDNGTRIGAPERTSEESAEQNRRSTLTEGLSNWNKRQDNSSKK